MPTETAIHQMAGPLLLLAGPGTGKTYQLAQRIKFLVEDARVDPSAITIITFTAAAAANMRARISDPTEQATFVARNRQPESIRTMHSLGYRIIQENAKLLGLPANPSVVQLDETRAILMGDAAQLAGFKRSDAKEALRCRQSGNRIAIDSQEHQICEQYCSILRACGAIDYDDQILLACTLLKDHTEVAAKYRAQATHLLVDEYQDINAGQFELIRALCAGQQEGLFVVGDDDQSIYSWRGGSPLFIRHFEKHFGPKAKVESLLQSRRCHRKVLEGSLRVVEKYDRNRRTKGVFTYRCDDGPPIAIHSVPSAKREAEIVLQIIQSAVPSKRVLVLVPTRRHATVICDRLRKSKTKYVAPEPPPGSGLLLLQRATCWLRDRDDSIALRECVEALLAAKSPVPPVRVQKPDKIAQREEALRQVSGLWRVVLEKKLSLWQSLTASSSEHQVLAFAHKHFADMSVQYDANSVADLLAHLGTSMEPWRKVEAFAEEIENWVSRFTASTLAGADAAVQVMTFQSAKGLEAETVCVVGLEDGVVPRAGSEEEALAEQSRLFFVSMTRAKLNLHLFHARTRPGAVSFQKIHKGGGDHKLQPSPFLQAIPGEYSEQHFHPAQS